MIWISKPKPEINPMCSPQVCAGQHLCTTNDCPPDSGDCLGVYIPNGSDCPPAFCLP